MKDILKKVHITSVYGVKGDKPEDFKDSDAWTVKLTFQRRQMTTPFFKGRGHNGAEPGKSEVLSCLVSDASCGEMSFEEFCGEFGYDTDSRRAEATWKACKRNAKRLRKLLGEHFDEIAEAVQDY